MNSCELVTLVTAIACTISQMYSSDELAVISSVFNQLGDTIATIQAQQDLCESKKSAALEGSDEDDTTDSDDNSNTDDNSDSNGCSGSRNSSDSDENSDSNGCSGSRNCSDSDGSSDSDNSSEFK